MNRRSFLAGASVFVIHPTVARPQARDGDRRRIIGVLTGASLQTDPMFTYFREELKALGYEEGRDVKFEFRTGQERPDRLPRLAEELVSLKPDVIVATTPLAGDALRRATSSIPIVVVLFDPAAAGLITNLARPTGNVTGLSSMTTELYSKRMQFLKEIVPKLKRVGVLWNPASLLAQVQTKMVAEIEAAARLLEFEVKFAATPSAQAFEPAFDAFGEWRAQALYLAENPLYYVHRAQLAGFAIKARLPAISGAKLYAEAGALVSYGASIQVQLRRAAGYVERILNGAKPADLPVEQPTQFELVVNLKTAKALGISIPEAILLRADEVIR